MLINIADRAVVPLMRRDIGKRHGRRLRRAVRIRHKDRLNRDLAVRHNKGKCTVAAFRQVDFTSAAVQNRNALQLITGIRFRRNRDGIALLGIRRGNPDAAVPALGSAHLMQLARAAARSRAGATGAAAGTVVAPGASARILLRLFRFCAACLADGNRPFGNPILMFIQQDNLTAAVKGMLNLGVCEFQRTKRNLLIINNRNNRININRYGSIIRFIFTTHNLAKRNTGRTAFR